MKLSTILKRILHEAEGQDIVEYALVMCLVALGAVVGIKSFGNEVATVYGQLAAAFPSLIS